MNKFCFRYIVVLYARFTIARSKYQGLPRGRPDNTLHPVADIPVPDPNLTTFEKPELGSILYITLSTRRADLHGKIILRDVISLFLEKGKDNRLQGMMRL